VKVGTVEAPARSDIARFDRLTKALEWPMAILALAVIPALLLDDGDATPRTHLIASAINSLVWLAFCGEFGLRLAVAPNRSAFVRRSWFDLLIIAISPPFGVPRSAGVESLRGTRCHRLPHRPPRDGCDRSTVVGGLFGARRARGGRTAASDARTSCADSAGTVTCANATDTYAYPDAASESCTSASSAAFGTSEFLERAVRSRDGSDSRRRWPRAATE
jgi:hypothetical protein